MVHKWYKKICSKTNYSDENYLQKDIRDGLPKITCLRRYVALKYSVSKVNGLDGRDNLWAISSMTQPPQHLHNCPTLVSQLNHILQCVGSACTRCWRGSNGFIAFIAFLNYELLQSGILYILQIIGLNAKFSAKK